jgi:hypothetical protein
MACTLLEVGHSTGMRAFMDKTKQYSWRRNASAEVAWAAGVVAFCLFAGLAQAQQGATNSAASKTLGLQASDNGKGSDNGNNGKAKGKSKPTVAERPQIIGSKSSSSSTGKGKPDRPGNPNVTDPPEVTSQITRFQAARELYLQTEKERKLLMKDATEEQRAALREKLKDALEKWKEEQKQFAEEQKERSKEMKQELHPDLGKVVDGAGGGGGNGRDR